MKYIGKVPKDLRYKCWVYQHAEVTFGKVVDLCNHLHGKYNPDDDLFYYNVVALYALYGRPFNGRSRGRVSEVMIPNPYLEAHKNILKLRDKVLAHVDDDGPVDDEGDLINKMVILQKEGKFLSMLQSIGPTKEMLGFLGDLSAKIRENCHQERKKIWDEYRRGAEGIPEGFYEINIHGEGEAPLLREIKSG